VLATEDEEHDRDERGERDEPRRNPAERLDGARGRRGGELVE